MRILQPFLGCVLLAGCFGAGPDPGPSPDDKAVVLARLAPTFDKPLYFARAIGGDAATIYVVVQRTDDKASGAIWVVAKDGSGHTVLADNVGIDVSIAKDATSIYWSDPSSCDVHRVAQTGGPATVVHTFADVAAGSCSILDLVVDDASIYVALGNNAGPGGSGGVSRLDPCCDLTGGGGGGDGGGSSGTSIRRWDKGSATESPFSTAPVSCTRSHCLWGDDDTIYYWLVSGGATGLYGLPKAGGTARSVLVQAPGTPSVSFIAVSPISGGVVAAGTTTGGGNGCVIMKGSKTGAAPITLLAMDNDVCFDLAADETSAYFTSIQGILSGESGSRSGVGIGRLPFTGGPVPATYLSIPRSDFIARRLIAAPSNLFLIDPFAVVEVPKTLVP